MVTECRQRDRSGQRPRVLISVQNLQVPLDRRVWLECLSLTEAGYHVTVICPSSKDSAPYLVIDGVAIHTYPPYAPDGSKAGFVVEYAYSFLATARLASRARPRGRFDVIQAFNPPDIFWPLARSFRRRDGSRFLFDHHDLCPELYESRFPDGAQPPHRGLLLLERATFRAADRVLSTNESYAGIAVRRGQKAAKHVTVVRTGPDPERLRAVPAAPALRRGREHLVAYLGVMGPLGGVELTGRVSDETVANVLTTADIGLSPDPESPLNDVSTMNKTMESREIVELVDASETRAEMGRRGRERVEQKLAWIHQKQAYVAVFDELVGRKTVVPATDGVQPAAPTDLAGAEA